jgi:transporter family protein
MKNMWWIYALLSALFAAFTAILAKIGIKGINSDLATAIRTLFILLIAWGIVFARKEIYGINLLSKNNWLFLGCRALPQVYHGYFTSKLYSWAKYRRLHRSTN